MSEGLSRVPPANDSDAPVDVRIARTLEDLLQVVAIRALVYVGEQSCPFAEEFDGNDLAGATHLIASVENEPAGVLRMRWFAGFAKAERLSVRESKRGGNVAKALIDAGSALAARKGYTMILGHIEPALLAFWKRNGAVRERPGRPPVEFSDRYYIEVIKDIAPVADALSLDSPALVLLRPEGEWDAPGVLDRSLHRRGGRAR
ncbi:MAG TPA: GNAT family N-acetyltransferase [Caulobacterales bacterium]|nr:GNAT family N-acetyltransferase [Caulobacterales bacterium]